jgi:hypothetical protein
LLGSDAFRDAHRVNSADFTRKRSLTLPILVAFLLQLTGGTALQYALDTFFGTLHDGVVGLREVSKSAFCQARKKLKASAFISLNRFWTEQWHETVAFERWCGLRVVAGDGTCLRVPTSDENIKAYGLGTQNDGSVLMARCVALFATATRQMLDITVGRYDEGERALLLRSLGVLKSGDVLVLDRGYPAWWLFAGLHDKAVQFCMRLDGCGWAGAKQLLQSSQKELIVSHRLNAKDRRELKALGLSTVLSTINVRLIKVCLPNGKLEILATSLQDTQRYSAQAFGSLYGYRWGVEEAFKTIKQHLDVEGFSGELPHAIEQDIHAKALIFNITQALCWEATQRIEPTKRQNYSVNSVYALKHAGSLVVSWLRAVPGELDRLIVSLVELFSHTLEMIRPNRNFPRRHAIGGAQRPRKAYR